MTKNEEAGKEEEKSWIFFTRTMWYSFQQLIYFTHISELSFSFFFRFSTSGIIFLVDILKVVCCCKSFVKALDDDLITKKFKLKAHFTLHTPLHQKAYNDWMKFTYLTLSVTQQIGMCIKLDINLAKFRQRQEIFLLSKQCVAKLPSLASRSLLREREL